MLPPEICDRFARQYGLLASWQLGHELPHVRRRVRHDPDVETLSPRVLRHRASAPVHEQALLAPVLDAGPDALLFGKSAATYWGFGRYRNQPVHVGRPRARIHGPRLGQVHVLSHMDPADATIIRGIPIQRPEAALLWIAGMYAHRHCPEIAAERLAVSVDHAWRQGLVDGAFLHGLADRSGGRGRSGIVALRAVLDERPPSYQPAGSRLEERFEELLPWRMRMQLRRQVTVDVEPVVRITDYRHTGWPLVVEINGEAFHTSLTDREADAERYSRLLSLGYSVVVFWEYDIWHDAARVREAMLQLHHRPDVEPTLHRPTPAPWAI